jgi:DNA-binding protein YbaB
MTAHFKLLVLSVALLALGLTSAYQAALRPRTSSATRLGLFGNPEAPKEVKKDAKGGGMFGGMGNMMEQMKKAQEIAKNAEKLNNELKETFIIGQDGSGGAVATFNGLGSPVKMKVSDELLAQGAEAVSAATTEAMTDGYAKSQNEMMSKMQALYGGLAPPPV